MHSRDYYILDQAYFELSVGLMFADEKWIEVFQMVFIMPALKNVHILSDRTLGSACLTAF